MSRLNNRLKLRTTPRLMWAAWIAAALILAGAECALAQQPGGAGRTVTRTYYIVDSILVGVLFLGALYAVCRSSRRT